jgi:hypothetical protein
VSSLTLDEYGENNPMTCWRYLSMVDLVATLVHTLVVVVLCAAAFYAGACMSDHIAAERQLVFVPNDTEPVRTPAVAPRSAALPPAFEKHFKENGRATCRL